MADEYAPPGADGGSTLRELVDVLVRNANIPVGEAVTLINALNLNEVEALEKELKESEERKYTSRNEDNDMGQTNLGVELYHMRRELEEERKKTLELRARIKHLERKLEELSEMNVHNFYDDRDKIVRSDKK